MKNVFWGGVLIMFGSGAMIAQEFPRVAFNLGAGFDTPVYTAGDRLDPGWHVGAGIGVNFHPNFGLMADFTYSSFGINGATLNALGFPGGDAQLWSATLDPVVHLNPRGPVEVYLTGGGGFYQWRQRFTAPTTATFTAVDPYFGVYYPVAVPATAVLSSYTVNKPGWNAGLGMSFGKLWTGKFYSEARFQRVVFGNNRFIDTVPVTFGFRW